MTCLEPLSGTTRRRHRATPAAPARAALAVVAVALACASLAPAAAAPAPAAAPEEAPPPVAWLGYREAKAEARHRGLPLLVFFTASWSTAGARIDREVWTDRRLRGYVAAHLVTARVDLKESRAVADLFGIKEPPALLAISPQGKPLVVLHGSQGVESYLRVATYAGSGAWEHLDYAAWLSRRDGR